MICCERMEVNVVNLGPITVFNKTIYNITQKHPDAPNYLHFIGWVYLWGAMFHWMTAVLNCVFILGSQFPTSLTGCP